jgi:xanthine dehydrogenase accessory factor
MGLGCQGVIQVLIEPLQAERGAAIIELLQKATASRQYASLVTFFSMSDKKAPQYGSCYLFTEKEETIGSLPVLSKDVIEEETRQVIGQRKSSFKKYQIDQQEMIVFTELIQPPVSLIVVGAGNDVIPVVKMAEMLGWQSTVLDGRPMYASRERFPMPSCQVFHSKADQILERVQIDARTVFVLMSHNYNYDLAVLKVLLNHPITYIGVLGPHKKMKMMMDELAENGIELTDKQKEAIHGPVGLHIGAETAEEIAVSIIAEIQAKLTSTDTRPLKEKQDAIHRRADLVIESTSSTAI